MKKIMIFIILTVVAVLHCNIAFSATLNNFVEESESLDIVEDDTETYNENILEEYTEEITTCKRFKVTFVDKVRNKKIVKEVLENECVSFLEISEEGIFISQGKYKFFHCWKDKNNKQFDFSTPIRSDITLYAAYYVDRVSEKNPAQYTVCFDTQGGTMIVNQTVTNRRVKNPNVPYKAGHVFKGWFTKPQGGEKWDFKKDMVCGNMTLYAQWEINGSGYLSPKTGYDSSLILIIWLSIGSVGISIWKLKKE